MSYNFYKIMHFIGLFMIFSALGSVIVHMMSGGNKSNLLKRKFIAMTHGIGALLVFVAGFGMMARLGLKFSDNFWIYGKILIWLFFGLAPVFIYKLRAQGAQFFWFLLYAVGALGAYLALVKPF